MLSEVKHLPLSRHCQKQVAKDSVYKKATCSKINRWLDLIGSVVYLPAHFDLADRCVVQTLR